MRQATPLRLLLITGMLVLIEIACRVGWIPRLTMIPPSRMVTGLIALLQSGQVNVDIFGSLRAIAISLVASIIVGFIGGAVLHGLPRARRVLDPFFAAYYSVPTFIFYPLIIVLVGFGDGPKIIIAFAHAVVVMMTNTLNGLDRVPTVLRKTARIHRLSPLETTWRVVLPSAAPSIFAGMKFAMAYSFVGVLGAEFILSTAGIGFQIGVAFNSFDNVTMYALILLVFLTVSAVNSVVFSWERRILNRRGIA